MVSQLLLYIGLLVTSNFYVMIGIWFSFGFLSSIRISVGYIYMMELLPRKAQTPTTTLWNMQEALIYLVAVIYFWKISTHCFWYVLVGAIWQVISVIMLFFMPESPRYLITAGRNEEARQAF